MYRKKCKKHEYLHLKTGLALLQLFLKEVAEQGLYVMGIKLP